MHKSMNACFYRTVNDECIIELYYVIIFQKLLVLRYYIVSITVSVHLDMERRILFLPFQFQRDKRIQFTVKIYLFLYKGVYM